jgi:hypothetical protein
VHQIGPTLKGTGDNMTPKRIAVAGHAGIGHVFGFGGLIQDDSGGFVAVGAMLREILESDTRIESAEADPEHNVIRITTMDRGTATASPRRGITPAEARLIGGLAGEDALFCQRLAVTAMGRMYGQGVLETPVALEAALANAVVDGFARKAGPRFKLAEESIESNCGLIGGMAVEKKGIAVSYLLSVNYTRGGLGPVEDLEGNVALGSKRQLMGELDMLRCPTIIVESKAYVPSLSDGLEQSTFLVRAQEGIDNLVVARALYESAEELGYPVILRHDLLPRAEGSTRRQTVDLAQRIIGLAEKLKASELASEKSSIVAQMAQLVSEDAGAITCLSDRVYDVVRGAGMIPGTSAVLSLLVTKAYRDRWKTPLFEPGDAERAQAIVGLAIQKIASNYDTALKNLERDYVSLAPLERALFGPGTGTTPESAPDRRRE